LRGVKGEQEREEGSGEGVPIMLAETEWEKPKIELCTYMKLQRIKNKRRKKMKRSSAEGTCRGGEVAE